MGNLRLVLAMEVAAGNQHTSKHSSPGLWELLDRLAPEHKPANRAERIRVDQPLRDAPFNQTANSPCESYVARADSSCRGCF
jgi:hypothetical protein